MDINEYQQWTDSTVNYRQEWELMYLTLGLVGEAGEVANKIKKVYRDHDGQLMDDVKSVVAEELGDVLWYMARLAFEMGFSMTDLADRNYQKLMDRKSRGAMKGSGDHR